MQSLNLNSFVCMDSVPFNQILGENGTDISSSEQVAVTTDPADCDTITHTRLWP